MNIFENCPSKSHQLIERHCSDDKNCQPIVGYAQQPLLPLSKACAPLIDIIKNISFYVNIALHKTPEIPPDGLTVDESASIRLYTMEWEKSNQSLYFILNQTLKNGDRQQLKPFNKYLKLFLTAIVKLPCVPPLTVWRGITKDMSEDFLPGTCVIWWSFVSCTTELRVLENNIYLGRNGNRTLFSIESINCRTIRNHSEFVNEDEVILLPGSQAIVQSQFVPSENLHIIHLKQIIPENILLELPFHGAHLYPKRKNVWYTKKRLIIPMSLLLIILIASIIIGVVLGIRLKNKEKVREINWIGDSWAYSCDFNGNNFTNITIESSLCGNACYDNWLCTHFTWVNISDGICFMKSGNISKQDAFITNDPSMLCGVEYLTEYVIVNRSIDWNGNNWAYACDFQGNDLLNVLSLASDCGIKCLNNEMCSHFSWNKLNGGTCYLKNGNVSKEDAISTNDQGMICGIL